MIDSIFMHAIAPIFVVGAELNPKMALSCDVFTSVVCADDCWRKQTII